MPFTLASGEFAHVVPRDVAFHYLAGVPSDAFKESSFARSKRTCDHFIVFVHTK